MVIGAVAEALPNGILMGEDLTGERLIHNRHAFRVLGVVLVEIAAGHQARLHGAEITGVHHVVISFLRFRWLGQRIAFAINTGRRLVEAEWQRVGEPR